MRFGVGVRWVWGWYKVGLGLVSGGFGVGTRWVWGWYKVGLGLV